jgi:hypothetical protein
LFTPARVATSSTRSSFFPNATLVADKFHVLRLLFPAINRHRKAITGDRRSLPVRRLLLRNGRDLDPALRRLLWTWLADHPALRELYAAKESLVGFYRVRGYVQAARILTVITDSLARSQLSELHTLRATLQRWRPEVLAYFQTRLTNGMTEGFNGRLRPPSSEKSQNYTQLNLQENLVGEAGFEPATTSTQSSCTTGLCDSPVNAGSLASRYPRAYGASWVIELPGLPAAARSPTRRPTPQVPVIPALSHPPGPHLGPAPTPAREALRAPWAARVGSP